MDIYIAVDGLIAEYRTGVNPTVSSWFQRKLMKLEWILVEREFIKLIRMRVANELETIRNKVTQELGAGTTLTVIQIREINQMLRSLLVSVRGWGDADVTAKNTMEFYAIANRLDKLVQAIDVKILVMEQNEGRMRFVNSAFNRLLAAANETRSTSVSEAEEIPIAEVVEAERKSALQ